MTAKMIAQAIEGQLTAKGLTKVVNGDADLFVGYQVAVNKEKQVTTFGTGYGHGCPAGAVGWTAATAATAAESAQPRARPF